MSNSPYWRDDSRVGMELRRAQTRQGEIRRAGERVLMEARAQGRENLEPGEAARLDQIRRDLAEADGRVADAEMEYRRMGDRPPVPYTTDGSTPMTTTTTTLRHDNFDLTYRRGINQPSWLRDLMAVQLGNDNTGECRSRLVSHSRDVAEHGAYLELRDLGRVDGSGGYSVPPIWLMSQYIELARPGRAFANLCQRQPLPGGTDSINVPKILTGTTVDVQTADNQPVSDTDLTDTFINSPVRTLAGQQGVAIQLIDQSPIAFDDLIFRDLTAAHATVTDLQVLSGSGTNGQVLGLLNTPNITMLPVSSVDIKGFWSGLANAIQTVHTTRFLPPEVIVMHPRRWGWFESLLDLNQRPLVVPNANGPFNAAALLTDVASQQVVGQTHGLPIVTDPNIPTTLGSGNNEDIVIVARVSDLVLWEGGIRARVLPETKAANLTVVLQVYSYLAFTAGRYPQSTCVLTGLTAPSW